MKQLETIGDKEDPIGPVVSACRKGRKWTAVTPGDTILLSNGPRDDQKVYGEAVVVNVYLIKEFRDIPARLVENNHANPAHMTYSELYAAMLNAYGVAEFTESDEVTVVEFRRTK